MRGILVFFAALTTFLALDNACRNRHHTTTPGAYQTLENTEEDHQDAIRAPAPPVAVVQPYEIGPFEPMDVDSQEDYAAKPLPTPIAIFPPYDSRFKSLEAGIVFKWEANYERGQVQEATLYFVDGRNKRFRVNVTDVEETEQCDPDDANSIKRCYARDLSPSDLQWEQLYGECFWFITIRGKHDDSIKTNKNTRMKFIVQQNFDFAGQPTLFFPKRYQTLEGIQKDMVFKWKKTYKPLSVNGVDFSIYSRSKDKVVVERFTLRIIKSDYCDPDSPHDINMCYMYELPLTMSIKLVTGIYLWTIYIITVSNEVPEKTSFTSFSIVNAEMDGRLLESTIETPDMVAVEPNRHTRLVRPLDNIVFKWKANYKTTDLRKVALSIYCREAEQIFWEVVTNSREERCDPHSSSNKEMCYVYDALPTEKARLLGVSCSWRVTFFEYLDEDGLPRSGEQIDFFVHDKSFYSY